MKKIFKKYLFFEKPKPSYLLVFVWGWQKKLQSSSSEMQFKGPRKKNFCVKKEKGSKKKIPKK